MLRLYNLNTHQLNQINKLHSDPKPFDGELDWWYDTYKLFLIKTHPLSPSLEKRGGIFL
jgi:hypothetical protein